MEKKFLVDKNGTVRLLQIVKIPDREIFSEEDKSSHTCLIYANLQLVNLPEFLPQAWHEHCQHKVELNPGHELPGLL
jgi:hypothetical protein